MPLRNYELHYADNRPESGDPQKKIINVVVNWSIVAGTTTSLRKQGIGGSI